MVGSTLQWRHKERDGVSDCLINRLFRRRSKKTSKLRITVLCEGEFTGAWMGNTWFGTCVNHWRASSQYPSDPNWIYQKNTENVRWRLIFFYGVIIRICCTITHVNYCHKSLGVQWVKNEEIPTASSVVLFISLCAIITAKPKQPLHKNCTPGPLITSRTAVLPARSHEV